MEPVPQPKEHRKEQIMGAYIFSITLFLHISGVLVLFAALVLEWISLRQIRDAARPEQVHSSMAIVKGTSKAGGPAILTILVTGVYMTVTEVGWTPWIVTTILAVVLASLLAMRITAPRMKALGRALGASGGSPAPFTSSLADDRLIWFSVQTRLALLLGIVLLKTTTPGWGVSLLIVGLAVALGFVSTLPLARQLGAQRGSAD
jgi:hypothetical protein